MGEGAEWSEWEGRAGWDGMGWPRREEAGRRVVSWWGREGREPRRWGTPQVETVECM